MKNDTYQLLQLNFISFPGKYLDPSWKQLSEEEKYIILN